MNKIIINDNIKFKCSKKIDLEIIDKTELFDVIKVNIKVLEDSELLLKVDNDEKLDINIEVLENVNFKYNQMIINTKSKIQNKFYLNENSNFTVNKFYDSNIVNELTIVNMNGYNSNIDYELKTICKNKQKYDLMIYHNCKNTKSNIINKSVNMDKGSTTFNVTGIVYNGVTGCILNQSNRIINLNDKKSSINPNLLIDEYDTEASHSALIGKFSEEEIFYLMSRGITRNKAYNLLIKGFLMDENKEVLKTIDKYWR